MREFIFATTAPNDGRMTDDASVIEDEFRRKGFNVRILALGWEQLCAYIIRNEEAVGFFFGYFLGVLQGRLSGDPNSRILAAGRLEGSATHAFVSISTGGRGASPPSDRRFEDQALHGRIDAFCSLFRNGKDVRLAERELLAILENDDLTSRPWARFRVESNLGLIAMIVGDGETAITRFEAAFELQPNETAAVANLAVARIRQKRCPEAMELARRALARPDRFEGTVAHLLQAAAQSDWQGDPDSLIPPDLAGTLSAEVGRSVFYCTRDLSGWQDVCLAAASRYPEADELVPFKTVAVISKLLLGKKSGDTTEAFDQVDLGATADRMRSFVDRQLAIKFEFEFDLVAHLNNLCVLLRIIDRSDEVIPLLLGAPDVVGKEPNLRVLLASSMASNGQLDSALKVLENETEPENQLLHANLLRGRNAGEALRRSLAVDPATLTPRLVRERANVICEAALSANDAEALATGISALRVADEGSLQASLFEVRGRFRASRDRDAYAREAVALIATVGEDIFDRHELAYVLREADKPDEASRLLDTRVRLDRFTPTALLYLECLAASRRDRKFLQTLADAQPGLRDHPDVLLTSATHAYNVGDIERSLVDIRKLIAIRPADAWLRLFEIDTLIRDGRQTEAEDLIQDIPADLEWKQVADRARFAAMLSAFGHADRALNFAYETAIRYRDNPVANLSLTRLILNPGKPGNALTDLEPSSVGNDAAVRIEYNSGNTVDFVVEPDQWLRQADTDSWEPEHPLVRACWSKVVGDEFTAADGSSAHVVLIRHKFVAAMQRIMTTFEHRFPGHRGLRSIAFDPSVPGGLDEFTSMARARHDFVDEVQSAYLRGPVTPLAMAAAMLRVDTIEMASGLNSQGLRLRVATGEEIERIAAYEAIRSNDARGCVLDLLTFWTAWRLDLLHLVVKVLGPVHVAPSVRDTLRAKKQACAEAKEHGRRTVSYRDGRLEAAEFEPSYFKQTEVMYSDAIEWLGANARVTPVIASDTLPQEIRQHLAHGLTDAWDATALSVQTRRILLTDDLPTRVIHHSCSLGVTCWLATVLQLARKRKLLSPEAAARFLGNLRASGHHYLIVSNNELLAALRADAQDGSVPGATFNRLTESVGGIPGPVDAHIEACAAFLDKLWAEPAFFNQRKAITATLLRKLLRRRYEDQGEILEKLVQTLRNPGSLMHMVRRADLIGFIDYFSIGHFVRFRS